MEKLTNVKAIEMAIELATGNDELVEKLGKIKASFEKKSGGEKKPTATQVANAGLKDAIVTFLTDGNGYTIGELCKKVPQLAEAEASNQKVSALVRGLMTDGVVVRYEEKRKAYFKLA